MTLSDLIEKAKSVSEKATTGPWQLWIAREALEKIKLTKTD